MKVKVYAIKDDVAGTFVLCGTYANDALAVRELGGNFKRKQCPQNLLDCPADFHIYCVGEFETEDGSIVPTFAHVANFSQFVEVNPNE